MENKELEWIHGHYKETFALSKEAQKDRNKFFVFVCGGIACLFMFFIDTNAVEQTIAGWYEKNISDIGIPFLAR